MYLWLLIAGVLIPQEFATTAIVFLIAVQEHYPLWPIHLIWLGTTALDMYLGYTLAQTMQKHFKGRRFMKRLDRWADYLKEVLGRYGERFSLAALGTVNFPYLNTFLAAWLGIPMRMAFLLTLAGNFVWYLFIWATILGVSALTKDSDLILLIIVAVGVLSHFLLRFEQKRYRRTKQ